MIIVAGTLTVAADDRDAYLRGCQSVIEQARAHPGCRDFYLSADPLDATTIHVYERWDSAEAVEQFRGSGPSDEQQALIVGADVAQYEIAGVTPLS